jgi:hypothetical protein
MGRDDNRIQYLQDTNGRTTEVLVPIELWEQMEPKDDSYKYTTAQLAEIEEGMEDYKAGRVISWEEALMEIRDSIKKDRITK